MRVVGLGPFILGALLGSGCVPPSCGGSGGAASRSALGEGMAAASQAVPPARIWRAAPTRRPRASWVFSPISAENLLLFTPSVGGHGPLGVGAGKG